MTGNARYWAFLSYSHADEAAAAKLHRALEGYTLPAAVRKAHGLPKRLIPVFRDVEELAAASGLTKRLQGALDESRWLIVLCSANSAASKYVNEEIEYFLKKHGPDRILCVLLEGEPPDCLPPAVCALPDEPLAADMRTGADFELALLKLIAAMATVGFSELRNREAQRKKQQRLVAASVAAAICVGALAWWDFFHREQTEYYTNYTRYHGVWHGVDSLSADAASRRRTTYKFTHNGRLNPPRRVEYVNSSGYCPKGGTDGPLGHPRRKWFGLGANDYCSVEFAYTSDGSLTQETWISELGTKLETLAHTANGIVQFTDSGFASAEGGSGVHYIQYTRDDQGLDRKVQFLHSPGNPRPNDRREFGWVLEYDSAGRVVRRSVLDDQGEEVGLVSEHRFNGIGLAVEVREVDLEKKPRNSRNGYSTKRIEFNADGNPVRETFLDASGKPAAATRQVQFTELHGFAGLAYKWDDRGNNTELLQLDASGAPFASSNGVAAFRWRYDERGNATVFEVFDAKLEPTDLGAGRHGYHAVYDDQNRMIETRAYDVDGNPVVEEWGSVASRHFITDRTRRECFFDADDKPVVSRYGACLQWAFDRRGLPIELAYFDVDGKPHPRADNDGVAVTKFLRNDKSGLIGIRHLGVDGKPRLSNHGTAGSDRKLDEYGNLEEVRLLDADLRLARGSEDYAVLRLRHDRSGNRTGEFFFDELERPTRNKYGYFGYRAEFDSRGRMIRKEFLDASGGPMKVETLSAWGERYEYDSLNREMVVALLREDGSDAGRTEHRYGPTRVLESRFLDATSTLAPHPVSDCVIERYERDGFGRATKIECLDANEQPTNRRDDGWAVELVTYTLSNVNESTYFDKDGREIRSSE